MGHKQFLITILRSEHWSPTSRTVPAMRQLFWAGTAVLRMSDDHCERVCRDVSARCFDDIEPLSGGPGLFIPETLGEQQMGTLGEPT